MRPALEKWCLIAVVLLTAVSLLSASFLETVMAPNPVPVLFLSPFSGLRAISRRKKRCKVSSSVGTAKGSFLRVSTLLQTRHRN